MIHIAAYRDELGRFIKFVAVLGEQPESGGGRFRIVTWNEEDVRFRYSTESVSRLWPVASDVRPRKEELQRELSKIQAFVEAYR